jgi:hypothetical protein
MRTSNQPNSDKWSAVWDSASPVYTDCSRPHSFYEMVEGLTKDIEAGWPLHRMTNIVRKRHERREKDPKIKDQPPLWVYLEPVTEKIPGFAQDDEQLTKYYKESPSSQAIRIAFFEADLSGKNLKGVTSDQLQGSCIIKRNIFPSGKIMGHVFEAVLKAEPILNHYLHAQGVHSVRLAGKQFTVRGTFFCQQNSKTIQCAHAAVIMALRAMAPDLDLPHLPTAPALNDALNGHELGKPLNTRDMVELFGQHGVKMLAHDPLQPNAKGIDYRTLVHAGIESGLPVLLAFMTKDRKTGEMVNHVVTVLGHTLNTDIWVAEAEFGYGVKTPYKYHPSYDWCPHWLINDDNLGMEYCLQGNKLSSVWDRIKPEDAHKGPDFVKSQLQQFDVTSVLVPLAHKEFIDIPSAERKTVCLLQQFASALTESITETNPQPEGIGTTEGCQWLHRLTKRCRPDHPGPGPILRTCYARKEDYLDWISGEKGEDWAHEPLPADAKLRIEESLPDKFWMTEFTLVDLFTANRRKLGEILYLPTWSIKENLYEGLLLARFPGAITLPQQNKLILLEGWSHVPMVSTVMHRDEY